MAQLFGKHRGAVAAQGTAASLGRLLVNVPSVVAEPIEAMPCVPYAGPQLGWYAVPPVGSSVWVEFEAGNIDRPIWTGCFWNEGELPVEATSPSIIVFKSGVLTLTVDDSEPGTLTLTFLQGENQVTLAASSTGLTCQVGTADGKQVTVGPTEVTLAAGSGGGKLTLVEASATLAQGSATVTAQAGAVSINEGALKVGE